MRLFSTIKLLVRFSLGIINQLNFNIIKENEDFLIHYNKIKIKLPQEFKQIVQSGEILMNLIEQNRKKQYNYFQAINFN